MASRPTTVSTLDLVSFLPLLVIAVAIAASLQNQEIWAATLVAIVAVWAIDLGSAFRARGHAFAPLAVVTSGAAGALAAHALGSIGYGLSVALAIAICLGWAVAFSEYRSVATFAPTLLCGLLAALGVASLILSRSAITPDSDAVSIFLVSVIAGVVAGSVVARMPAVPFLDPYSVTAIVAVIGSVLGAVFWKSDVVGYLLIGLGLAIALIAGQGFSTMIRTGQVRLTERARGLVPSLDGIALAAAIYFPLIQLIL